MLAELTQHPVATPLLLTGTIVVGRDIAHAKFKGLLDAGKPLPDYLKEHPIYYAGPAKTPARQAFRLLRARPRPAGWTPMWTCCSPTAAR